MASAQHPPPAPAPQQTPCRLFKLPGELRNRIYRDVLVVPGGEFINVTSTGYDRPGLLSTSKEIHAEALSIFYHENKFRTHIRAYDSTPLLRLKKAVQSLRLKRDFHSTSTTYGNPPSWKNLLLWLRRYHAREVDGRVSTPAQLDGQQDQPMTAYVVVSIFLVVDSMRSMPWKHVEKVVKEMRPTLVKADSKWGDEEGDAA